MDVNQIVYLIAIVSTGAVFYATGYWTGKNTWRKTGHDEGYLEALRAIETRKISSPKTQLRTAGKKGKK